MELKAKPGRCEEASVLSHAFYIPCNAPADRLIFSDRDETHYRMCQPCASHSVRNRGMRDCGPFSAFKGAKIHGPVR